MLNPLTLPLNDVSYISPEVAQGFAGTNRSDLYSLGVILYEMCTGAMPFHGDTPSDILLQHIHGTPTSPALINPQIPPALTAAIMRSLARDPAARYPTATALVTSVARALNISMPESISHAHPSPGVINPPSLSGMDTVDARNSPTYLSQQPQQSLPKAPSVPPSPVISSSTPALPVTPTGSAPVIQVPPVDPRFTEGRAKRGEVRTSSSAITATSCYLSKHTCSHDSFRHLSTTTSCKPGTGTNSTIAHTCSASTKEATRVVIYCAGCRVAGCTRRLRFRSIPHLHTQHNSDSTHASGTCILCE